MMFESVFLTWVAQVGLMALCLVADVLCGVVDVLLGCGVAGRGDALVSYFVDHCDWGCILVGPILKVEIMSSTCNAVCRG